MDALRNALKKVSCRRVVIGASLMGLGFAMALCLLWLTGDINLGKDAPAWVQAIGSIAAILIAIAVPAAQHYLSDRKSRFESKDRARSLGLLLLPAIQDLADWNNRVWSLENPQTGVEMFGDDGCFVGPVAERALEIPATISAVVTKIHELGPAAEGIQRALYSITRAKELTNRQSTVFRGIVSVRLIARNKAEFYRLLWDAKEGLNRSRKLVEGFFAADGNPLRTESSR